MGTLAVDEDHDLGETSNRISFVGNSALLSDPLDSGVPTVLSRTRTIDIPAAITATLGNSAPSGSFTINGPLTGSGTLAFNGIGTLTLGGENTFTGAISYATQPAPTKVDGPHITTVLSNGQTITFWKIITLPIENQNWESTLRFAGPDALPSTGVEFALLPRANLVVFNSTLTTTIDLGGYDRLLLSQASSFSNYSELHSSSHDSTLITEFTNGTLRLDAPSLDISAIGTAMTHEWRLPADSTTTLTGPLSIGTRSSQDPTRPNSSRLRIGTNARFHVAALTLGDSTSSGRLDAQAPGANLTLRGPESSTTGRVPLIRLGYGGNRTEQRHETVIDLHDGTVDILADRVAILGASDLFADSTATSKALLDFGDGMLDATTVILGDHTSTGQLDNALVQRGGTARIRTLTFGTGSRVSDHPPGPVSFRYELRGGSLAVGNLTTTGTYQPNLTRSFNWSGGTVKNYPGSPTLIDTTTALGTPLDIELSGPAAKFLEVEPGQMITFGSRTRLTTTQPDVILSKIGAGALCLGGDTTDFSGSLQLQDGTLALGLDATTTTTPLGAFHWSAGTLACDLSPTDSNSDRLKIARTLTKGTGPTATRIIDLKSSPGIGEYTLASYAHTDLTLADLTATGISPGYSADFAIGPTALTVTLGPDTPHSLWRRAHFATSSNLGPAADLADPDSDGRPNLLEYALGSEPATPDATTPASIAVDPATGRLQLTFNRIADPGLTYAVRAAPSPSGPWTEVIFASTGSDNTAGPVTVTDTVAATAHPTRFLRLFVSR